MIQENVAEALAVLAGGGLIWFGVRQALAPLASLERSRIAAILDTAVAGHDRVWFVLSQAGPLGPIVRDELPRAFLPRLDRMQRGVELFLYERAGARRP